jgi:hypothetical protein
MNAGNDRCRSSWKLLGAINEGSMVRQGEKDMIICSGQQTSLLCPQRHQSRAIYDPVDPMSYLEQRLTYRHGEVNKDLCRVYVGNLERLLEMIARKFDASPSLPNEAYIEARLCIASRVSR